MYVVILSYICTVNLLVLIMAIQIIDTTLYKSKLKCTIQASGKLGFTAATAQTLELNKEKFVKFANDDAEKNVLYMIFVEEEDAQALKVCKAGAYYYVSTQALFDFLGYDYKNKTIIFDMTRTPMLDKTVGGKVYKMTMRKIDKKKEVVPE